MRPARPFLTAQWRHLLLLNYAVDPALLRPHVPAGTSLDAWGGVTYVSLVGFLFQRTRVGGVAIPAHEDFPEVNLRFYVRREEAAGVRRGVVFLREVVPRLAVATVARWLYHENYVDRAMGYRVELDPADGVSPTRLSYGWREAGQWLELSATGLGPAEPLAPGSLAEFIAEHYWGYSAQPAGGTVAYQVEHPPWTARAVATAGFRGDGALAYGPAFGAVLAGPPASAFVADGSAVTVYQGARLALPKK